MIPNKENRPSNAVPSPDDITRVELDNGLIILVRPNFNSPSVVITGGLNVGSLNDQDETLGLADFTSSALMRGTQTYKFNELYDKLESVGASLGFSGGTHTTGFNGKSLVEDLDMLLGMLSDVLCNPSFPEDHIEKLRALVLTGLSMRAQSTSEQAAMAFDHLVYKGHPYSRPDEGYVETVNTFTRQHLINFHAQHYGPQGMRIAIVGGIDPDEAIDKVRKAFENWENPAQKESPKLPAWQPLSENKFIRKDILGKSQSDLVVGTAGPERNAPAFLPAVLGNSILGQFGMMGRIGESVREKAGLAYYAYSGLSSSIGPGPWLVAAGVNPKNEEKAVHLIMKELARFVTDLVDEEELKDNQANFIGRIPLSLESNIGVAASLLHIEKHQLGLDYYIRYPEMIRAITREEILAAAKKYLDPSRMVTAIAGPPLD